MGASVLLRRTTMTAPRPVGSLWYYMQSGQPFDIATCMYYTGIDPFTNKPVKTAKNLGDRKLQRALMQFFKPENYFAVREALVKAGRGDLIGGCDGLIPSDPPKDAIEARRRSANSPDHYHAVPKTAAKTGYRPNRPTQTRRTKPGRGPNPSPPTGG
ncbi:MAG: hypothetical protein C0501_12755 [Isosphaera sp.]|nr:hypothetical protein [Isosphaera sp.]